MARLIVLTGLPGTGKSRLARRINIKTLRTDIIRKKLKQKDPYTEESKKEIYEIMFKQAKESLLKNEDIILDGNFSKENLREKAKALAKETNSKYLLILTTCSEKIIKERLDRRNEHSDSDARWDTYLMLKETFEKPKEAIIIDTSKDGVELPKELKTN